MATDVQQIIDRILSSSRAQENRAFAGRTFTDEPILQRGSQMESYLPERIRQMREMAHTPQARTKPAAQLFYEQARLMEDYEDDIESYSTFSHYYATYESMGNRDLRRYFSWRTRVRYGKIIPTSLTFAFVLFYEYLCGIGVDSPEDGFRKIEQLWQGFRIFDPKIDRHAKRWLRDYAAWHDLPRELVLPYTNLKFDASVIALRDAIAAWPDAAPGAGVPCEQAMLEALDELSSYRPRVSRLYRDYPETLCHVMCATTVQLAAYYDKHRKNGLVDTLFGSPIASPYVMFGSAVFYSPKPHPDATYELDEVNRYVCRGQRWYRESYLETHERNSKLGAILRAIDQRLRTAIGYEHPLTEKDVPKYLAKIIDEQIGARLEWERQREARMVRVDLSQLEGIRADASVTREALLVDEEREESPAAGEPAAIQTAEASPAPVPVAEPMPAQPTTAGPNEPTTPAQTGEANALSLTDEELSFVSALLEGQAPAPAATSLDMLVDSVNEKLFELLGDTAIEFGEQGPAIIEDYLEDVRGALLP